MRHLQPNWSVGIERWHASTTNPGGGTTTMTQTDQILHIRRAEERGRTVLDWLDSYHSFSFGHYRDPAFDRFGPLRVLNDDRIAPGGGFGEHPHHDAEIITWVLAGALRHRDSLGHEGVIGPGEVQAMSAGRGIRHSEFNDSPDQPVHLLQIWLLPDRPGHEPRYSQQPIAAARRHNRWALIASPDGREGSLAIHQDALIHTTHLEDGCALRYDPPAGRRTYLHVARGAATINDTRLSAGDALRLTDAVTLHITADGGAELLLFDLP